MANQIGPRYFLIDTASVTPIWLSWVDVQSIVWTEAAAAGATAIVKNASGSRVIFDAKSSEANDFEQSRYACGWVEGLLVDTLSSGKLQIICN